VVSQCPPPERNPNPGMGGVRSDGGIGEEEQEEAEEEGWWVAAQLLPDGRLAVTSCWLLQLYLYGRVYKCKSGRANQKLYNTRGRIGRLSEQQ